MLEEHDEKTFEIIRWCDKVDEVAVSYEAKWGIGNLQDWAPKELQDKFHKQREKLYQAVCEKDVNLVAHLSEGMIRGWKALEDAAIKEGRKPIMPEYMEVVSHKGRTIRIARTVPEARMSGAQDVVVFSLKEIAHLIESQYEPLWEVKKVFPQAEIKQIKDFNWELGDEIVF